MKITLEDTELADLIKPGAEGRLQALRSEAQRIEKTRETLLGVLKPYVAAELAEMAADAMVSSTKVTYRQDGKAIYDIELPSGAKFHNPDVAAEIWLDGAPHFRPAMQSANASVNQPREEPAVSALPGFRNAPMDSLGSAGLLAHGLAASAAEEAAKRSKEKPVYVPPSDYDVQMGTEDSAVSLLGRGLIAAEIEKHRRNSPAF